MGYQPFYISGFEQGSGENTYFEPFLIPEKAFQKLEDAVCWRGKILKRPGITHLGRLRRNINAVKLTDPAGKMSHTVADILDDAAIDVRNPATGIKEEYAEIEPGSVSITVGAVTFTDPAADGILVGSVAGYSGTINYVTGELNLTFPVFLPGTDVFVTFFYYPALPCMGLQRRETSAVNNEQEIAFDTKYAYTRSGVNFIELPSTTPTTWQGEDWNLFWAWNYYVNTSGMLYWATNNNTGATPDPIRYYNGTTWTDFNPIIDSAGNRLQQCRLLISYKNRLIAMNTWEGNALPGTNYQNKIRWSVNGDPTGVNAWNSDTVGQGGYLVAPTNEAIISAAFIRDTLIVKFERSSWKLVYTGNENLPFVFQKVNTDLGSESPFSLITFDKGVLAVGDKGITIDDSVNVSRIDRSIPNAVFTIKNAESGTERVYGIRDFSSELVYWSYPDGTTSGASPKFPNKVIVYNYINETWCKFNDSFTCYGYFQKQSGLTWADCTIMWKSMEMAWNSGAEQSLFPDIVGGNQQGFVSVISSASAPRANNGKSLAITAINGTTVPCQLTIPNHNLQTGQFIKITGIIGTVGIGGLNPDTLNNISSGTNRIFRVTRVSQHIVSIEELSGSLFTSVSLGGAAYTGVYWGGGTVSVLNNFDIISKQFSPFYEQGSQCRLGYIDFFTEKTTSGEFSADVYIDSNNSISITNCVPYSLVGSNAVSTAPENISTIPFQSIQSKIWHRLFVQSISQNFTLELSLSDKQIADPTIDASASAFTLHALAFYLSPNARLVQ